MGAKRIRMELRRWAGVEPRAVLSESSAHWLGEVAKARRLTLATTSP
jgi:hypothetical protein